MLGFGLTVAPLLVLLWLGALRPGWAFGVRAWALIGVYGAAAVVGYATGGPLSSAGACAAFAIVAAGLLLGRRAMLAVLTGLIALAGMVAFAMTTDALPHPDPAPSDPYADVPVTQIGSISIPAIGLDHAIYEGVWLTVLDHGPGHWPGSAMPGQRGNAVFPGHRVTHSRPFYDLDLLVPGDEITFLTTDGAFTYAVTGTYATIAGALKERYAGLLDRTSFYQPYPSGLDDPRLPRVVREFNA